MTRDEILEIYHRLHVYEPCHLVGDAERRLNELFEAIAAKEREACAKVLDMKTPEILLMAGEMTAQELRSVKAVLANRAETIRARGDR